MTYITEKIESTYNFIDVISSDENAEKLIIRIRTQVPQLEGNKKLTQEEYHSEEVLKYLESKLLKELSLKGIGAIKKVYVKEAKRPYYDNHTGAFVTDKMKEFIIETDGTNLSNVFLIDEVDFTRSISNDINEIYSCLGVEAVRKALSNELRAVLKPYDIHVNYRHIAILCDVMTQRGLLTAITRHGINRVELGPLRKCSFEETVEILLEAGLFAETDFLTGITENIMVGQLAPFGTGCFDLLIDMNKIQTCRPIEESKIMEQEEEMFVSTPRSHSPSHTPFMNTPNQMGNMTSYQATPGMRQSPMFTPAAGYDGNLVKSPSFHWGGKSDGMLNYIKTPNNPMMSPNSITSPGYYNPSDYFKSPYTPVYEAQEDNYGIGSYNVFGREEVKAGTEYSKNTSNYSPTNSMPSKSPYITGNYPLSSVSYSLQSPSIQKYGGGGYQATTSNPNYSPTTPINQDYMSNFSGRTSNYSGVASPRIQESVNSAHSSQSYSPRSPTYNPKSPSYNLVQSGI
jgi:DNA-directed RNA polymerase II subunit RPB1